MKKKLLSTLLATAMLASALTGCGSEEAASTGSSSSSSTSTSTSSSASKDSGASSSSEEPVKLTALFCAHPLTQDVSEMEWVAEMEAEANVEIEWECIRADWDTVKSTRFASGDIPDLLFSATTDADYTTYNGLFLDIAPLLSKELTFV